MEILLVITVISVMIALLMPALQEAKGRAKTAACISKLRGIGAATVLFADDYRYLPAYRNQASCYWYTALTPYLSQHPCNAFEIGNSSFNYQEDGQTLTRAFVLNKYPFFDCPAAGTRPRLTKYGVHYACNDLLYVDQMYSSPPALGAYHAPSQYMEGRPADLILVCDAAIYTFNNWESCSETISGATYPICIDFATAAATAPTRGTNSCLTPGGFDNDYSPGSGGYPVYSRHDGVCYAVMADGHVRGFKNGEMQRRNFASKARAYETFLGPWVNIQYD